MKTSSTIDKKDQDDPAWNTEIFPWNINLLKEKCPLCGDLIGNCHFYFWDNRMLTINKLMELYPGARQPKFNLYKPDCWYLDEVFTHVRLENRAYLIHTQVIPNSFNLTLPEQEKLLPPEYEIPLAIEEVMKSFLFYEKTRKYPNRKSIVRVGDMSSKDLTVYVGDFTENGIKIGHCEPEFRFPTLGISASRKIP